MAIQSRGKKELKERGKNETVPDVRGQRSQIRSSEGPFQMAPRFGVAGFKLNELPCKTLDFQTSGR